MKPKRLVLVTNDDGVRSEGLFELAKAASKHADVVVVAPDQPQSATAMSLTFHKPLRVEKYPGRFECYAVSGSPGDCVMVGVNKLLPRRPDLVVSGINVGDNDTFQDILASGTVAAALQASIAGIGAVAFSMEVEGVLEAELSRPLPRFSEAGEVTSAIVKDVLTHGMPEEADILNVNFPSHVSPSTEVSLTGVGRRKYTDRVIVRKDPRGRPYYWLFGEKLPEFPKGTDADAVLSKHLVSVTPIALKMSGPITKSLEELKGRVGAELAKTGSRSRSMDK